MTKRKDGMPPKQKKPDYCYHVIHYIPVRDPNNPHRMLRDEDGKVIMKEKFGPWENGYLNRNIDCYDAYLEDQYIGTVHVKTTGTRAEVKKRFLTLHPFFAKDRIDEVEFLLTCRIGNE